jgi:hypothetical protein
VAAAATLLLSVMWGALVLLVLFLLINRDDSAILQSLAEEARQRFSLGDPFSNVVIAIMVAAAIASALLMIFRPRLDEPQRYQVFRRYFGPTCVHLQPAPAAPPLRTRWLRVYLATVRGAKRRLGVRGLDHTRGLRSSRLN